MFLMAIKVGINGFGRIGRNVLRAGLNHPAIEFMAVNDLTDTQTLAHLLKYDSTLGPCAQEVRTDGDTLRLGAKSIKIFATPEPAAIDWSALDVQVVVESTGRFTDATRAQAHRRGSVKKVLISAPATNADVTVVLGVNDHMYDPATHHVISNASCTTNCLAPVVKVLHQRFGIAKGSMTTIHSYTNDQQVLDFPHPDLRRARAAALNMIPTSTGAAQAIGLVLPELQGKLDGYAMRVPTPNVSVVDLVAVLQTPTTADEINAALAQAATNGLQGILGYTTDPVVSSDMMKNPHSAIVDARLTRVLDGTLAKVVAWYDNEWGYSCRVADLIVFLGQQGL
jgi:glyceraldehyde 3-phosphate dehydrogenase (phosphorylating)